MMTTQPEFQGFPATQRETASESTIQRFLRLSNERGPLVPQSWLHEALGLSKQRISQFLQQGRFNVLDVGNTKFVAVADLEAFKVQPRITGRPKKV
jgi:hypothetical protein